MRIIIFANVPLLQKEESKGTGTWIDPIVEQIINENGFDFLIFSFGIVDEVTKIKSCGYCQYIIPWRYSNKKLPKYLVNKILLLIEEFNPDIIHLWGTETTWYQICVHENLKKLPLLIDIQGFKSECSRFYTSGISIQERIRTKSLGDLIRLRFGFIKSWRLSRWRRNENLVLNRANLIHVPSDWAMLAGFKIAKKTIPFKKIQLPLRKEFIKKDKITSPLKSCINITVSASGPIPYKGIHTVIKSLKILKNELPKLRLNIIGDFKKGRLEKSSYTNYLQYLINKFKISELINWCGPCNANEIREILDTTDIFVSASFIESYGMALLEAIATDCVCVSSSNGGCLEIDSCINSNIFKFNSGDELSCATAILKALSGGANGQSQTNGLRISQYNPKLIYKSYLDSYKQLNKNEF